MNNGPLKPDTRSHVTIRHSILGCSDLRRSCFSERVLLFSLLLVTTVDAARAVPLQSIAQFIGNLSRADFGFIQILWKQVGLFLLGAIPFSIVDALS
ncbi:hypothetical protein [Nitrosomonas sp. Nm34]|uniref:hypothetical protein n=1 Tax=Nitrosomonas sp. Nm34 TaxID=1881055 RepID=UPI000B8A1E5E|nr:hypothetical protein [Nitrosomonas sp. Nm34]